VDPDLMAQRTENPMLISSAFMRYRQDMYR